MAFSPYCAIEISRFLREPALSFAISIHLYYLRSLLRALQSLLRHLFLRASSVISSPATLLQIFPTEKTQIIIIYSSSPQKTPQVNFLRLGFNFVRLNSFPRCAGQNIKFFSLCRPSVCSSTFCFLGWLLNTGRS